MIRVLSEIKQKLVPRGKKPRTILGGLFGGIRMELDLSSQTQLYLGLFERETHKWFRQFSKNIRTAIDIGVAYGEHTRYFLLKTPAEKVFSFEPEEEMRKHLLQSIQMNGGIPKERLVLLPQLVSSFNDSQHCTLDSLLPKIVGPCLIKMDVDGDEVKILEGASKLLCSQDTYWIIETHSPSLEAECIRILQSKGYSTKVIPQAWYRLFIPELRVGPLGNHNRWLIAQKVS